MNPLTTRRPSGALIEDGIQIADTLQCVHCGGHWQAVAGSGKVRGFCRNCMGPVCGPGCAECMPFEKRLDLREKLGKSILLK